MIELDEKDIKAVGRSRFNRRTKWKYLMFLPLGILILLAIVGYLLGDNQGWFTPAVIVAVIGFLSMGILYIRKEGRAEKKLIEEWKEEKE